MTVRQYVQITLFQNLNSGHYVGRREREKVAAMRDWVLNVESHSCAVGNTDIS